MLVVYLPNCETPSKAFQFVRFRQEAAEGASILSQCSLFCADGDGNTSFGPTSCVWLVPGTAE